MEAQQRRSSGFQGDDLIKDGTRVRGTSYAESFREIEQHVNFEKMMVGLKSTWIPKSAEKCPS